MYWLTLVEQENPGIAPWLFVHDLSAVIWVVFAEFWKLYSSAFVSSEHESSLQV